MAKLPNLEPYDVILGQKDKVVRRITIVLLVGLFLVSYVSLLPMLPRVIGLAAMLVLGPKIYKYATASNSGKKLEDFARANNLDYTPQISVTTTAEDGIIFGYGRNEVYQNVIERQEKPSDFIAFQYAFTDDGTRQAFTDYVKVLQVKLPNDLPRVVLDGRGNNFVTSNLQHQVKHLNLISLEGDFDNYFKTYTSEADEFLSLAIITPDVMEFLKNHPNSVDVEIMHNKLIIYGFNNASFQLLANVAELFLTSAKSNIKHYKQ